MKFFLVFAVIVLMATNTAFGQQGRMERKNLNYLKKKIKETSRDYLKVNEELCKMIDDSIRISILRSEIASLDLSIKQSMGQNENYEIYQRKLFFKAKELKRISKHNDSHFYSFQRKDRYRNSLLELRAVYEESLKVTIDHYSQSSLEKSTKDSLSGIIENKYSCTVKFVFTKGEGDVKIVEVKKNKLVSQKLAPGRYQVYFLDGNIKMGNSIEIIVSSEKIIYYEKKPCYWFVYMPGQ